eukprot:scaffold179931_cov29-Tisochrysis_lutea.AAC.1
MGDDDLSTRQIPCGKRRRDRFRAPVNRAATVPRASVAKRRLLVDGETSLEEREAETEEGLEVAWDVVKVVMGVGAEKDLGKEEREAGVTKEMEQRVVAAATAMVVMAQAGMVLVVAAAMARGHEVEAEAEVEAVGRMDLVAA